MVLERIKQTVDAGLRIESTSDNPEKLDDILQYCEALLDGCSFEVFERNGKKSLLAFNTPKRPAKFRLILNGHLDVVPAKPEQFTPKYDGTRLYARGAYDMKCATLVQLLAFVDLAAKVDYPLGLQLVCDEEIGGYDGTKYQLEQGICTEFAIAGEPTDFGVNSVAKGLIQADIDFFGTTAHAAYPWQGKNAVWSAYSFLEKLAKRYPEPNEEQWQTTVNLANIASTQQPYNKVADKCSLAIDVRFVPEERDSILDTLQSFLPKGADFKLKWFEPPHFADADGTFVKLLRKTTADVIGEKPEIIKKHAASDLRHFSELGMQGVTFGPRGAGQHTDDEWVDLPSLEQFYNVLSKFILRLDAQTESGSTSRSAEPSRAC